MNDETLEYRSGAVARMLRMPVATLRIWERRYGVCQPKLTASGQRLYTAAHIQRLALIRQLVGQGHAIGTLAALDQAQLQAVASTHASTVARGLSSRAAADAPTVGWPPVFTADAALRRRLDQPDVGQARDHALTWTEAPLAPVHLQRFAGLQVPSHPLYPPPGSLAWGVVYRYASAEAAEAYTAAGAVLLREPADANAIAQWLDTLLRQVGTHPPSGKALDGSTAEPPSPRWDDATLMAFAGLSTTIACECPRHLAELLMQLRHFEAYSADCAAQGPADAELHHHLRRTAAQARVLMESALARVAEAEGLIEP